jgi:hypothetical protein
MPLVKQLLLLRRLPLLFLLRLSLPQHPFP